MITNKQVQKKPYKKTCRVEWTLGKFDWGSGRRENLVVINFGYTYLRGNKEAYFSASGEIWNRIHTDCINCGQCLDTIKARCASKLNPHWRCLLFSIVRFWDNNQLKYHSELTKEDHAHLEYLMKECVELGGVLVEEDVG